ncbi:hypothetical protein [Tianweitania sediminis]|uniref:Uncharacterized protein n=1 Tax=Tianweitania sediminis TaxID=1502156 RepID=A0A8J7RIL4_9HYPH|nr:hypothetical protein [Tianweitania sediminis]MBP0439091.1 hypothetical protein [Tianweitania sediminis]
MIVEILRSGAADAVVQGIAADLIKPPKQSRGRRKSLPKHWLEIGEEFHHLRDEGVRYEEVLILLAEKYGRSETHVRTAVATFDRAKEDAAADRNQ